MAQESHPGNIFSILQAFLLLFSSSDDDDDGGDDEAHKYLNFYICMYVYIITLVVGWANELLRRRRCVIFIYGQKLKG